jgi:hypothetical protein
MNSFARSSWSAHGLPDAGAGISQIKVLISASLFVRSEAPGSTTNSQSALCRIIRKTRKSGQSRPTIPPVRTVGIDMPEAGYLRGAIG